MSRTMDHEVVVIGAGFSGIGTSIRLTWLILFWTAYTVSPVARMPSTLGSAPVAMSALMPVSGSTV